MLKYNDPEDLSLVFSNEDGYTKVTLTKLIEGPTIFTTMFKRYGDKNRKVLAKLFCVCYDDIQPGQPLYDEF